jgi:hypothetical protein
MAQHVAVDGKHPPRCRPAWRESGASSGGARTGRGSGPRGPRPDACCTEDRSVPWRRQRPRQDDGGRPAVRRVPGRVSIQAHHAMLWLAPSCLVDVGRVCPHEVTAYGGAGQANSAVCSAPTWSRRSPAAQWSRIVHAPLLPPRRASKSRTGPPDWGQEHCAARLCAVLPTASGTTSARGRRSTSRMTGSRASWCRSWTAPSWSRSASGAAQSWKTGWGPPTRVAPCLGVWRGSNVVSLCMTRP